MQLVHATSTCNWYIQLVHATGIFNWYMQLVHTSSTYKLYIHLVHIIRTLEILNNFYINSEDVGMAQNIEKQERDVTQ